MVPPPSSRCWSRLKSLLLNELAKLARLMPPDREVNGKSCHALKKVPPLTYRGHERE